MAEFVVYGRDSRQQPSGFVRRPRVQHSSLHTTCRKRVRTTTQSKPKSSNPRRCTWSSIPIRGLMISKTAARRKLAINTRNHGKDISGVLINSKDMSSSTSPRKCAKKTCQSSELSKHKRQTLYGSTLGHGRTHLFGTNSSKCRAFWQRSTPKGKPYKRLWCQFQKDNMKFRKDPWRKNQISKNSKHSHKAVQVPSVELNQEVAVQACRKPLISISQMFSNQIQTIQGMDDGQALMEQEDEEKCKNKEPLQGEGQRMLQAGEEMQAAEEEENEQESSQSRSGIYGWWELLCTGLPSMRAYVKFQ
ncbi:uncharacterized protein LOC118006459 isoform X2 [Mirounga leonina]|uniref:uncharacterized protein LOC118006459 isoform X1 n=1 Tax=Mirounga leonina TaxID=9715 RepID=UPI00156C4746|nr:uncharacterized protein LOC118006459 isoform X1 [Mirounga leonina]XP_034855011.1 uncharacterized protein LOC118006459 isoform X2 [Mirounga leonina]